MRKEEVTKDIIFLLVTKERNASVYLKAYTKFRYFLISFFFFGRIVFSCLFNFGVCVEWNLVDSHRGGRLSYFSSVTF
jgi:hypothetical protein